MRISVGIARRRTNNRNLIRRKNALAECVFSVALSQSPLLLNREASQKVQRILTKNRSEAIFSTPNAVVMIAKDNDPRFCAKRKEIFILFDSYNAHSRDGFRRTFFAKGAIFPKSNFTICIKTFDALFFLPITFQPDFPIRM